MIITARHPSLRHLAAQSNAPWNLNVVTGSYNGKIIIKVRMGSVNSTCRAVDVQTKPVNGT